MAINEEHLQRKLDIIIDLLIQIAEILDDDYEGEQTD